MTEKEIIKSLETEGYEKVWVYDAEPNEIDEEHKHDFDTKLHILSGEIEINNFSAGKIMNFHLKQGDEIEIPRNQVHSAQVGINGCRYIVAERH
jgi:quercetin dioxygenase-like cupin family protein